MGEGGREEGEGSPPPYPPISAELELLNFAKLEKQSGNTSMYPACYVRQAGGWGTPPPPPPAVASPFVGTGNPLHVA